MKAESYVIMLVVTTLMASASHAEKVAVVKKDNAESTSVQSTTTAIAAEPRQTDDKAEPGSTPLQSEADKMSYAMGSQMGAQITRLLENLKSQGMLVNHEIFIRGISDKLTGQKPLLHETEQREIMTLYQQRMTKKRRKEQEVRQQERLKQAPKNLAQSEAFLEKNKNNPDVKTLPSGLQYKVLKEGTGQIPTAKDRVKTHYRGTLINGEEFDSSYKRGVPASFAVNGVIAGWTEALQLMKVGAKWQLFIPPNLAYGETGTPGIPPNSALIFEIELIEVLAAEK